MALRGLMARDRKTGQTGSESEAKPPAPVSLQSPAPRTVSPTTSVDASSELEGRLRCKETLRIDGRIKGEIHCEKSVLVGEGARVLACITADEVRISGLVEGDVAARRKITLERTAVVNGDLTTPGIVIEEGAKLQGRILIGSEPDSETQSEPKQSEPKQSEPKSARAPTGKPLAASA